MVISATNQNFDPAREAGYRAHALWTAERDRYHGLLEALHMGYYAARVSDALGHRGLSLADLSIILEQTL
jgi:hypothetical protein